MTLLYICVSPVINGSTDVSIESGVLESFILHDGCVFDLPSERLSQAWMIRLG